MFRIPPGILCPVQRAAVTTWRAASNAELSHHELTPAIADTELFLAMQTPELVICRLGLKPRFPTALFIPKRKYMLWSNALRLRPFWALLLWTLLAHNNLRLLPTKAGAIAPDDLHTRSN